MKKFIKLFTPILGVSTIAAIAAPMSSCSCSTCTITLTTDGNGELSQTTLSVAKGTSFAAAIKKLKITANDGYSFNGWVDKDGKKFNTRKGITSNFSAKAVFEESAAAIQLYWNLSGRSYLLTEETMTSEPSAAFFMDYIPNKTYVFKLTVNDNLNYAPRAYVLRAKINESWQFVDCFNSNDITVTKNNSDITSDCTFTEGSIVFPNELRATFQSGDVITIKHKFNYESKINAIPMAAVKVM